MRKNIQICCLTGLTVFLFSACSWQEYFIIKNETKTDIKIEYTVENPVDGFQIFENDPSFYQLDKNGKIDWNEKISVVDLDTSFNTVSVFLPANCSIIIGHLSNDKYVRYDQHFINGRIFNLKKIKIQTKASATEIIPENFDEFFYKKNGNIEYTIR